MIESKMPSGLRSSQKQLKDELYSMYKKMTDPKERAKEARQKELKEYKSKKEKQYGL